MAAETEAGREPLLSIRDLSVSFRHGMAKTKKVRKTVKIADGVRTEDVDIEIREGEVITEAAKHVTFDIMPGESVGLVGESGSGKSVTALSVLRLLPYPPAFHPSGQILFRGKDLMAASDAELRRVRGGGISMIFQEPMTSLNPVHTIERQISETLKVHQKLGDQQARRRTVELLQEVGIADAETRLRAFPHQLSGGQRQRVMIAMALANNPSLLIADEPTTAVDVTIQAQILNLLQKLQRQNGMAILFITHDLGIVRKFCDRVFVMTNGEIVERGTAEAIFTAPSHPYTKRLLAAEPKKRPVAARPDAEVVARVDDLKVWFPIRRGLLRRTVGYVKALDGVDIEIRAGQTLGVVGESGSGKTTLGRALLRLVSSEGRIVVLGQEIQDKSWRELRAMRRNMQIVFQDPFGSLSPRMTVSDIVEEGLGVHERKLSAEERDAKTVKALREVGIDPAIRFRYPHEFSGGQRQRISVARALILEPRLVVLDEPTSSLDVSVQAQVIELFGQLQEKHDLAYLFISHDLKVVRALANRMLVLRNGKVVEQGDAEEVFQNPKEDYTKALLAAALNLKTAPEGVVRQ